MPLAPNAVVGPPDPAVRKSDGGYAYWVMAALHGLREGGDRPYRRLPDVLREIQRIAEESGLEVSTLTDFTTACAKVRDRKIQFWLVQLRMSAEIHETGEIRADDATDFERIAASLFYAKTDELHL